MGFALLSPSYASSLLPLGEFDGDALRAVDEDQLSRMEVHDLVAGFETVRRQLGDFLLDRVDREADVVHADLVEVADMRVRQGIRMLVSQELDLSARLQRGDGAGLTG